jgi:hypothetical protein
MGNKSTERVKAWRNKQSNIKEIRAEEASRWRAAHPEVAKEIKKRYRDRHRELILPREAEQARNRRKNDPEGQKRRNQKYAFKRSIERENLAGRKRPDLCEICGEFHLRIVFDHCHNHGHFRGWICDRCNKTLGMVKDSGILLGKLARYLEDGKVDYKDT